MIIYKITNLINNKIYIGQSNGKNKFYMGSGLILHKAIKKYGIDNFKKDIIVEGDFNQKLTDSLEIHYIRLYNSTNKIIGYNIDFGGWGGYNKIVSEETRKKISIGNKKAYANGLTDTHRQNMSKSRKGRKRSIEEIKAISIGKRNKSKKFSQFDLDGNFIKTWNSLIEFKETTGKNITNIVNVLKGRRNKAHNSIFKYI